MTMLSSRIPETEYESICNLLLNQRQSASECSHVRAHKVQDCGDILSKVKTGAGFIFTFKKSLPSNCMSTALHRAWPSDGRRGHTHNYQGDKLFCVGFQPKCRKAKTPFTFKFSAFTWELKKLPSVSAQWKVSLAATAWSASSHQRPPATGELGEMLSSQCARGFSMVT